MQESFLHFVWQNQYFNKAQLRTTSGAELNVLDPGRINLEDGPDFLEASIKIDRVTWVGPVEIHIHSSHWFKHKHQEDPAYQQVILHVVWEDDRPVFRRQAGKRIPTLTLSGLVLPGLVSRYRSWNYLHRIPCHPLLRPHHQRLWKSMMDDHLVARFASKMTKVAAYCQTMAGDWDATAYHVINTAFGFKKNSWAFGKLSAQVPLEVVRKVRDHPLKLEALFFGQSGLLPTRSGADSGADSYLRVLLKEYLYLKRKFSNLPPALSKSSWKFKRIRPRSSPALRMAQLAGLHCNQAFRFAQYRGSDWLETLQEIMRISLSNYWQPHGIGRSGHQSRASVTLNDNVCHHLIINAILPLRLAYDHSKGRLNHVRESLELLRKLPCEQNVLVNHWKKTGFTLNSAYHSQALLNLDQMSCAPKKCLQCPLGIALIRPEE